MTDWRPFTLRALVSRYKSLEREFYRRQSHGLSVLVQCITGKHVAPDALNPTVKAKSGEVLDLGQWTQAAVSAPPPRHEKR